MRAIIFDFDGTIADSFPVVLEIAHQITHKDQLVNQAEIDKLRKLSLPEIAQSLHIRRWQWPFLLIRGRRKMAKRLHEVQSVKGIPEVLAALKNDGYELYIMSSNSKRNVQKFLVQHGLSGYFLSIYGGIGLMGKASALKKILSKYNLNPQITAYIGDEPRDIEASKKVGMPCVAVAWGFTDPQLLLEHSPMVLVRTTAQLQKVLLDWGQTI